ncbi:MAG: hypothetical protein IPK82_23740 [Polyangiaceae bacterium]|nr:hypothetical protein [Polyangiaceae bacterium]
MPVRCLDGDITDETLAQWRVANVHTRIALTCEQVRAVFEGSALSRGIALLTLSRAQFHKLFPTESARKNPLTLRRWAARISGERARRALMGASWHQLRAAAAHKGDEAQIGAAVEYLFGVRVLAKRTPHELLSAPKAS